MKLFQISENDDVAVAFGKIQEGDEAEFQGRMIKVLDTIPEGHKVALRDIRKGEGVVKYGETIGIASCDISKGSHVHLQNVESAADEMHTYTYALNAESTIFPGASDMTFMGYPRLSGEAGTRNYIAILSGTFCPNPHMNQFAAMAAKRFPATESFDGFISLPHENGCGMAGDDVERTCKAIANLIANPNFGGVLFVEIGCEITPFKKIEPYIKHLDQSRFEIMRMQDEDDEFEKAMGLLEKLYKRANQDKRVPCPISKLHVALHCGGSDAFSGITSNPLLGKFAEKLCGLGGTMSITEVSELIGAEQTLMNRATDRETFEKIVNFINNQHQYLAKYGASANNNPSIGNKEGGITTIEEKSLGCIQKGGKCAVVDVADYGTRISKKGLNLVYGTGNDIVGITSQLCAGANLVLFSTGRGTPVGGPAPTLKVTSNNRVYEKKRKWADFNAGRLLNGENISDLSEDLFKLVMNTADGTYKASNEKESFYQIGIFRDGAIL